MVYSSTNKAQSIRKKVRVPDLILAKGKQPLSCVTCYDATFARLVEKSRMDIVLVGDSLGHVVQGASTTIGVTIEDVAYHTRCVAAALRTPLLVADMPFGSSGFSPETAFRHAEMLVRAGAEAVKIEGASPEICQQIAILCRNGIPVMGHLGLTPQSVHALGGYRIQGKSEEASDRLVQEAKALQDAGCFAIVLELVTSEAAARITQEIAIPTIGIGSGPDCDGQILVLSDMLGMNLDFNPKFLRRFAMLEQTIVDALETYVADVSARSFPEGEKA